MACVTGNDGAVAVTAAGLPAASDFPGSAGDESGFRANRAAARTATAGGAGPRRPPPHAPPPGGGEVGAHPGRPTPRPARRRVCAITGEGAWVCWPLFGRRRITAFVSSEAWRRGALIGGTPIRPGQGRGAPREPPGRPGDRPPGASRWAAR